MDGTRDEVPRNHYSQNEIPGPSAQAENPELHAPSTTPRRSIPTFIIVLYSRSNFWGHIRVDYISIAETHDAATVHQIVHFMDLVPASGFALPPLQHLYILDLSVSLLRRSTLA